MSGHEHDWVEVPGKGTQICTICSENNWQEIARLKAEAATNRAEALDAIEKLSVADAALSYLKAELASKDKQIAELVEAFDVEQNRAFAARNELAGSQNEAKALSESLDGMQKTLTETQEALDKSLADGWCDVCCGKGKLDSGKPCLCGGTGKAASGVIELRRLYYEADDKCERLERERDTANELLKRAYSRLFQW